MSDPNDYRKARERDPKPSSKSSGQSRRGKRGSHEERSRQTAPLVLLCAALLLVGALVWATSTLRTPPEKSATDTVSPTPPVTMPTSSGAATDGTTSPDTPESPLPEAPAPPSAPAPPAPASTPSGDAAALQQLTRIASQDMGRRPRHGQIVIHLQNRAVGGSDEFVRSPSGNTTWTARDILTYHRQASARSGGATLLKEGPRWISAVWDPSWTSESQARNWCYTAYSELGRDYDNNPALRSRCFVKKHAQG